MFLLLCLIVFCKFEALRGHRIHNPCGPSIPPSLGSPIETLRACLLLPASPQATRRNCLLWGLHKFRFNSNINSEIKSNINVRINVWRIQTSEFSTELMWWRIQANPNPPRINSDINVGINVCCSLQLYYDKTPPTLIPTLIPGLMCGGFRFV